MRRVTIYLCVIFNILLLSRENASGNMPGAENYFVLRVVDAETSRGIPLVKLTTVNGIALWTDSAGIAAFCEPGLMNRDVFFHVESHGYSYPADWLGQAGKTLKTTPGETVVLKMNRENIAQRLYRITGQGIYRDTLLTGGTAPIREPLLNASVLGQDSTLVAPYRGLLFWIWGDTSRASHPIAANFKATGGTSLPPESGGLDPEIGVNITYFREKDFVRRMAPLPGQYMYWLYSLLTVPDATGQERLLAHYARVKAPMETVGRGLVQFNDEREVFEEIRAYSLDDIVQPDGHPFRVSARETEYFYFPSDSRFTRVRREYQAVQDHCEYEAFTCLRPGTRPEAEEDVVARDARGRIQYAWRRNTAPVGQREQEALIRAGWMKPGEKWFQLTDPDTGKPILYHGGSIYWNEWRRRWVIIFGELFGTSVLGEIWYAEGDTPLGPWGYAKKIITHTDYSFYNPVQHPHFAKAGGRVIFLEGTYTRTFSGTLIPTPRYEYNQIMYKLELDDPRLVVPVPIYHVAGAWPSYRTGPELPRGQGYPIAFHAPDRPAPGLVAVVERRVPGTGSTRLVVATETKSSMESNARPVFYALPLSTDAPATPTLALLEYRRANADADADADAGAGDAAWGYAVETAPPPDGFEPPGTPVCRVWKPPVDFNPLLDVSSNVQPPRESRGDLPASAFSSTARASELHQNRPVPGRGQ
jgi:hypothetical protein